MRYFQRNQLIIWGIISHYRMYLLELVTHSKPDLSYVLHQGNEHTLFSGPPPVESFQQGITIPPVTPIRTHGARKDEGQIRIVFLHTGPLTLLIYLALD
jgi:hypothetical protein